MRIALTGATGFVGRHCIDRLATAETNIQSWYRSGTPTPQKHVQWIRGELNDDDSTTRLVAGCDTVIHTALSRSSDSFMSEPEDPVAYYETNVLGTLKLIEAAQKAGVTRLIFLSSGAVHDIVADDLPLDERHPLWPTTLYGASKAAVETLVHAYGLSGKMNIATLRPVAIAGIDTPIERSKWHALIQSVAAGKKTEATGGGKVVFVDDVVSAIDCLLHSDANLAGQTYNICSGSISHYQVATLAKELTGSDAELIGPAKESKRSLCTDKIQKLGMHFSGEDKLREIVQALANRP
ncbi:NAD-dependent epimerase/dehydratase family protein [Neorhodopirellula lusitana]|uniref:NAD-dependent epimerase/dehydratase family protein n=1 Tax=Neorhodopirellula lusitana TaxID=445327 RepID=UPI00384EF037